MLKITEFTLTKYKQGKTPSDGEVIWAYATTREAAQQKNKAIARLCKYIEQKDPNRHEYYDGDFVELTKMRRDAPFNDNGEVIYKKPITGDTKFHRKAIQRLARYLSKRDDEYIYFGKLPLLERGENCYVLSLRSTKILNVADKEKQIKNQIRGKKAAITRNINKAKKLRESYKATLFPDEYKTDKRYISLVANLYKQKKRLADNRKSDIGTIPTVIGGHVADISGLQGMI
ncbi:hypothetical protein [Sulfurimonas sp.]